LPVIALRTSWYRGRPLGGAGYRPLWGTATVDTDSETSVGSYGMFTYNLNDFASAGLESPDNCFIAVRPERVLALKQYSIAGRETWRRR
jgi:hypothetical protein